MLREVWDRRVSVVACEMFELDPETVDFEFVAPGVWRIVGESGKWESSGTEDACDDSEDAVDGELGGGPFG